MGTKIKIVILKLFRLDYPRKVHEMSHDCHMTIHIITV